MQFDGEETLRRIRAVRMEAEAMAAGLQEARQALEGASRRTIGEGGAEQGECADPHADRAELVIERRRPGWQSADLVSTVQNPTNPKWLGPEVHPLVRARKQAGLTQREAAAAAKVPLGTLVRMEKGGGTVLEHFIALADLYDKPLDVLVGRVTE